MYAPKMKRTVHVLWSSRAMFVLASAGAVIGFNNFWQFPTLVVTYGGGAFLLVYLFCVILLGIPLLTSQIMLARLGRDAPDGTFRRVAAQVRGHRRWWVVGAIAVLGGFIIFSYLSVIAGWTVAFALRAAAGAFTGLTADGVSSMFTLLVLDPEKQLFWFTLFVASIGVVSGRGLREGLEPAIRYAAPALFALMFLLLLYSATTSGFVRALSDVFMPDFSRLSMIGVLAAAGHAFFSLGLGASAMLMYGAYLERDASALRLSGYIVALDTLAGVVGALIVYAVLYAGGVEPAVGPALLFQAIPLAFDHLAWGHLYLAAFFIMLVLAAWLSGLALFEPVVMWVVERFEWRRASAAMVCGIAAWSLGIVFLLSFNAWSFSFGFFGDTKSFGIFDIALILTNHLLLPIVGIGTALFAGWVFKADLAREQLRLRSPCSFDAWLWLSRIVVPITLVCIMFQLSKLYT